MMPVTLSPRWFSRQVLDWFDQHGRKQLPWQHNPTPYRVWVSEIMLQQTQVTTAAPYFLRFMTRFPDVATLAAAPLNEVLALLSGLGYYARARNLHRAAELIRDRHDGELPTDIDALSALPGIGRSTAGAILALSLNQRQPILDGNVKRVLARFHAIAGWPGQTAVTRQLWQLAERYTPWERVAEYTQAMMDLGSMVCTRRRPLCSACPIAEGCVAHAEGREHAFPQPKPRRELPVRRTRMLLLCLPDGRVLLEQRPPTGVWGGLWSFPECPPDADVANWCRQHYGLTVRNSRSWSTLRHTFSHFHLDITPMCIEVTATSDRVMAADGQVWYNTRNPDAVGLPAPVQRLLATLANDLRDPA